MISTRETWDEYFMKIAHQVSSRSTCLRRQIGAVIVKDHQILSTGYNGAPAKIEHCLDNGCIRNARNIESGTNLSYCYASHAEMNAICQAAKHGTCIKHSIIYTTTFPCSMCAKMIINSGIVKIIFKEGYPDELSEEILIHIEKKKLKNMNAAYCYIKKEILDNNLTIPTREGIKLDYGIFKILGQNDDAIDGFNLFIQELATKETFHAMSVDFDFL